MTERNGKAAANSTLAIGGVSSPLDRFVVAESSVFRIKFSGEKPAHRQSAKRYGTFEKTTMRQLITIFFGLLFFTSCDCYQVVTGTVIDNETRKPIEGISIYNKTKPKNKTQTDLEGKFELSSISGGLFGCPPMTIVVEHPDYATQETEIPAGGQKEIILSRSKEQSCMEKIDLIFQDYVSVGESVDSKNNKEIVSECLKSLENEELTDKEFNRLIELWMYYDPTDFPTRDLVFNLFKTRKVESIKAIKKRIEAKQEWEDEDNGPFSELTYLIERLEKE